LWIKAILAVKVAILALQRSQPPNPIRMLAEDLPFLTALKASKLSAHALLEVLMSREW